MAQEDLQYASSFKPKKVTITSVSGDEKVITDLVQNFYYFENITMPTLEAIAVISDSVTAESEVVEVIESFSKSLDVVASKSIIVASEPLNVVSSAESEVGSIVVVDRSD